jgi:hypothetical protein
VRKNRKLRVPKRDNLEIERFTSVKRNDLAIRQPHSEITIAIDRDRQNGELLREVAKLARSRRVLLQKGIQRPTQPRFVI